LFVEEQIQRLHLQRPKIFPKKKQVHPLFDRANKLETVVEEELEW
jgi:hypothetical protein